MIYFLDGQRLMFQNNTHSKITELYFIIPQINAHSKVKKIAKGGFQYEQIFSKYSGDLNLYFKSEPEIIFNFPNIIHSEKDSKLHAFGTNYIFTIIEDELGTKKISISIDND